jgi:hypothetical protein
LLRISWFVIVFIIVTAIEFGMLPIGAIIAVVAVALFVRFGAQSTSYIFQRNPRACRNTILGVSAFSVTNAVIEAFSYFSVSPSSMEAPYLGLFINEIPFGEVLVFLAIAAILSLTESLLPQPKEDFSTDFEYVKRGCIAGVVFFIARYTLVLVGEIVLPLGRLTFVVGTLLGYAGGGLSVICYLLYRRHAHH